MSDKKLPKDVKWVQLTGHEDDRGVLTALTERVDIEWDVRRVFWITDVPEGQGRGCHAHRTCHELAFAVSGAFDITIDDGEQRATFCVDSPQRGIVIPAGTWCELRNFRPGTVCLVLASEEYKPEGYIR